MRSSAEELVGEVEPESLLEGDWEVECESEALLEGSMDLSLDTDGEPNGDESREDERMNREVGEEGLRSGDEDMCGSRGGDLGRAKKAVLFCAAASLDFSVPSVFNIPLPSRLP